LSGSFQRERPEQPCTRPSRISFDCLRTNAKEDLGRATYGNVIETNILLLDLRVVLLDESGDADGDVELVRVRVRVLRLSELLDDLRTELVVLLHVTQRPDSRPISTWSFAEGVETRSEKGGPGGTRVGSSR
jgi:hypothetical protein